MNIGQKWAAHWKPLVFSDETIRLFMETGQESDLVLRVAKEQRQRECRQEIQSGEIAAAKAFAFTGAMRKRLKIDI